MGGGKKHKAKDDEDDEDKNEDEEEELVEFLQIDLGDMPKMKQVLDEAAAYAILQHVPEDYKWDNIKLILMTAACLFAMGAQFCPIEFPESRPVIGVCGALYFVISGILQIITVVVDKDSIVVCRPPFPGYIPEGNLSVVSAKDNKNSNKGGSSGNSKTNKLLETYGIRVRTDQSRFSEHYKVILEFQLTDQEKQDDPAAAAASASEQWSVGQFFDKEGYFDEIGCQEKVSDLYQRFAAGNYDNVVAASAEEKKKQ